MRITAAGDGLVPSPRIGSHQAVVPPESESTSRRKGTRRNLRGLTFGHAAKPTGPHREGEEPEPMMQEREKSDPAIVAVKLPNKTGQPAAEAMERRAGAKENASQHNTRRTQSRGA